MQPADQPPQRHARARPEPEQQRVVVVRATRRFLPAGVCATPGIRRRPSTRRPTGARAVGTRITSGWAPTSDSAVIGLKPSMPIAEPASRPPAAAIIASAPRALAADHLHLRARGRRGTRPSASRRRAAASRFAVAICPSTCFASRSPRLGTPSARPSRRSFRGPALSVTNSGITARSRPLPGAARSPSAARLRSTRSRPSGAARGSPPRRASAGSRSSGACRRSASDRARSCRRRRRVCVRPSVKIVSATSPFSGTIRSTSRTTMLLPALSTTRAGRTGAFSTTSFGALAAVPEPAVASSASVAASARLPTPRLTARPPRRGGRAPRDRAPAPTVRLRRRARHAGSSGGRCRPRPRPRRDTPRSR